MNSENSEDLRSKAWGIYDYIRDELLLTRPDLEVKGQRFNATLLMSLLTGVCQGKALIVGEPGLGKTSSAEYICSLLFRLPLGTILRSEITGHPEQTEEKIIGRPDLGKLNQGREVVVWSYFTLLPVKIVDELNRLPETKQSMILDGVDRGKWKYLNDAIVNQEFCLFSTANYEDRGTNTIIVPLVDRFDIMVESKHPGANLAYQIGTRGLNGLALCHEEIEGQLHRLLDTRMAYQQRMDQVEEICGRFAEKLAKKHGIRTLSRRERQTIRRQKDQIPFDLDANAFLRFALSELSFCHPFGQKRSHEVCEEACHFSGYLCNQIRNCISNRFPVSTRSFSQALAWFTGDETVDLEHLLAVLPFALAHRIQWKEEALARHVTEARDNPLPIHMAQRAVKDMHRRYREQSSQVKDALSIACRIAEGDAVETIRGDHPLYWEIRRDLGQKDSI